MVLLQQCQKKTFKKTQNLQQYLFVGNETKNSNRNWWTQLWGLIMNFAQKIIIFRLNVQMTHAETTMWIICEN